MSTQRACGTRVRPLNFTVRPMAGEATARALWAFAGVPATYALTCYFVAPLLDRYPQRSALLLLALIAMLVTCIWTGATALFRLLRWSTPVKIAVCLAYVGVAYIVLVISGMMAMFARVGLSV
jgi:MFS family permease